jgi:uncharacterized membrane-anchored protein YhcB (DUF1043 family)
VNWKRKEPLPPEPPPQPPFRMPADNERLPSHMEEEILRGTQLESAPRLSEFVPRKRDNRDQLDQGRRIATATAKSFAALPIGQLDDLAKKHNEAKARFDAAKTELLAHFEHIAEDLVTSYQREIETLEEDSTELEQLLVNISQRRKPPDPVYDTTHERDMDREPPVSTPRRKPKNGATSDEPVPPKDAA